MTADALVKALLDESSDVDPRVTVLLNRAVLQIYNHSSILAFLIDSGIHVRANGEHVLQFVFEKMPQDVLGLVEQAVGASHFKESEWSEFVLDGKAVTALELTVDLDALPTDRRDYAY